MICPQPDFCAAKRCHPHLHLLRFPLVIIVLFVLAGCQFVPVQPQSLPTPTPEAASTAAMIMSESDPLATAEALPPVLFQLPELDIEFRVSSMGWTVVEENGERTTRWIVPLDSAGWHVNSVGAGGAGNTILSGQQTAGDAVFAPLALGEIQPGQQILLTASDGQIYAYEVTEVSQPIPIIGATEADKQAAEAYITPSEDAKLTLITGWPDFSTTHRVFAVAKFVGKAEAP